MGENTRRNLGGLQGLRDSVNLAHEKRVKTSRKRHDVGETSCELNCQVVDRRRYTRVE